MFIAALFAIAGTWKQPKCPSTGEWIKKIRYEGKLYIPKRLSGRWQRAGYIGLLGIPL